MSTYSRCTRVLLIHNINCICTCVYGLRQYFLVKNSANPIVDRRGITIISHVHILQYRQRVGVHSSLCSIDSGPTTSSCLGFVNNRF